jgi:hypothetical protein
MLLAKENRESVESFENAFTFIPKVTKSINSYLTRKSILGFCFIKNMVDLSRF